jgi:alanyl-tRNA synthetase
VNGGRGKLSGEDRTSEGLIVSIDRACRRRAQAHHTATHLLQAALKQLVDPAIAQAGSLVDFDRLRFDFHCPRAVSREELEHAQVRVVDVPGVSMELCGGTHVANTAEIGLFKIVSETGVAAGIRRIEAVAGPAALAAQAEPLGSFQLLVARLDGVEGAGLQGAAQQLQQQLGEGGAVVLGGLPDPADLTKVILVAAFGAAVVQAGAALVAALG